ncbi:hypothetical protein CF326_g1006, partial [Tilletia indica]
GKLSWPLRLNLKNRSNKGLATVWMRCGGPILLLNFDACLQGNHHLCWSLTRLNSSVRCLKPARDLNAYDDHHHRSYKDTIIAGYDQPHLGHGPHRP